MNEWIKCSDKPPQDGQEVLATGFKFENENNDRWYESAIYRAREDFFDFCDDQHEEHYQPTHWQLLPDAP